jgi:hypothetical protein
MEVGIFIGKKMKRFASILLAVVAMPSFAQLNGDGYYRVQNAQSGNYTTVVDNKADKNSVISTSNIDAYALNTVSGFESVVSDPGSIIYIEKKGSQGYILRGQGMDSYQLTGFYLQIPNSRTTENAYWATGTYAGVAKYLYEAYNESFGFGYLTTASKNPNGTLRSRDWYILPVNQEEGHYFGITPELKIGEKYYTTLYTSFPYQLSEGMKAYYVKQYRIGGYQGSMAEMIEIESGTVPGSVPVIIECNSSQPADNKVTPLTTSVANNFQNELKGIYFSNVIRWADDGEPYPDHKNWNATAYNPATMRVLGEVDGKLGFIKSDDLEYLPANKAYLPINEEESIESVSDGITLVSSETFTVGIENINTKSAIKDKGIYTITGTKLRDGLSIESLPNGIYIVDGKKTIVR